MFVVRLLDDNDPESLVLFNIINHREIYRADPACFGLGELVEREEIDFEIFIL